jgi:adenosylcobinamide kinase/adenosylcobinamide-phosphate guanylyltransferase
MFFFGKNIFFMGAEPKSHIIFITGGERSGKSRHALDLARGSASRPIYLATARPWDDDFRKRILRHQQERDEQWTLVEEEKQISRHGRPGQTIVVDCITLWLTNYFADLRQDTDACLRACREEIDRLMAGGGDWIIISNEIGMGVHAGTEAGRKFTELQGWINQYIAEKAARVILMISGIPLTIKPNPV